MKTLLVILVLAASAFFYVSCNDADSILTSPGGNTANLKPVTTFTGTAHGMTEAPNGMTHPLREFTGTGTSSLTNGECTIILDYWALPNGTSILGRGKLIAANGNELHAVNMSGTWSQSGTTVTFNCTSDLAGGTGQFINALGSMTFSGTMDGVTRVTNASWTGTLTHAKPFSAVAIGCNTTVTEPPCGTGFLRRVAEGSGNALHMGDVTYTLSHCFSMSSGFINNGSGSVVSASGDIINLQYIGCISPKSSTEYYVLLMSKIVSGTGKFADVEGSIVMNAVQNVNGYLEGSLNGAIDY